MEKATRPSNALHLAKKDVVIGNIEALHVQSGRIERNHGAIKFEKTDLLGHEPKMVISVFRPCDCALNRNAGKTQNNPRFSAPNRHVVVVAKPTAAQTPPPRHEIARGPASIHGDRTNLR